jgi:hypothetical protein
VIRGAGLGVRDTTVLVCRTVKRKKTAVMNALGRFWMNAALNRESAAGGRRALAQMIAALAVSLIFAGAARAYSLEATFDDEDDGAGAHDGYAIVDNLEHNFGQLGAGYETIELTGTARRSLYGDGRYGRGVDFPGGATARFIGRAAAMASGAASNDGREAVSSSTPRER